MHTRVYLSHPDPILAARESRFLTPSLAAFLRTGSNDGDLDLYVSPFPPSDSLSTSLHPKNLLFRNNGGMASVEATGTSLNNDDLVMRAGGSAWGDYNGCVCFPCPAFQTSGGMATSLRHSPRLLRSSPMHAGTECRTWRFSAQVRSTEA